MRSRTTFGGHGHTTVLIFVPPSSPIGEADVLSRQDTLRLERVVESVSAEEAPMSDSNSGEKPAEAVFAAIDSDSELNAIRAVLSALVPLKREGRLRVLDYVLG